MERNNNGQWSRLTDRKYGVTYLVFTRMNPRKDGYTGDVEESVSLDYDMAIHDWPMGQRRPEACAGRSPSDSKHYKVFKYREELQAAGFEYVPGTVVTFGSWADYIHMFPELRLTTMDEGDFFDYLDNTEEQFRERRRLPEKPDNPASKSRDDVAAWVAKSHIIVDRAIREVWYLPNSAPANEIRFLEVSDRMEGPDTGVTPLDFGLNVQGTDFQLLVADVTTDQLEQIKQNPSRLPRGWSLDGNKVWSRRG